MRYDFFQTNQQIQFCSTRSLINLSWSSNSSLIALAHVHLPFNGFLWAHPRFEFFPTSILVRGANARWAEVTVGRKEKGARSRHCTALCCCGPASPRKAALDGFRGLQILKQVSSLYSLEVRPVLPEETYVHQRIPLKKKKVHQRIDSL